MMKTTTSWVGRMLALTQGFAPRLRALFRERQANVAIMFALASIPMLGAIGLAVDYSRFMALRSTAQTAADSAALFAAKAIKDGLSQVKGSSTAQATVLADAKARADAMFASYVKNAKMGTIVGSTTVSRTGNKISARVDYGLTLPTTMGGLLGLDQLAGSSSSDTISGLPLFIDIYLMLDNSQSMGLAATDADAKALFIKTAPHNCVFGCHVGGNEAIAIANGITMRIDVLRQAAKNMIKQAQDDSSLGGFYRFGLYTMSYDFVTLAALTDNLSYAATQANKVALGYNDASGFGDSNFNYTVPKLVSSIKANGDGLSQDTAKSYVFLVTDGSYDVYGWWCTWGHCTSPIDSKLCKAYKDKGATVGVIYTTYLPVMENPLDPNNKNYVEAYRLLVQPFAPSIAPALKACASDGWFFEASNEQGIQDAMSQLFKQINTPPTLTN